MKYKGINYDVGTKTTTGGTTRETFDVNIVRKEIEIIKNELHCNPIRISGNDSGKVFEAAEIALETGLTVWFSPSLHYDNRENTLAYIIKNAAAAEKLRSIYPNLVFLAGCEFSLFTSGFIGGNTGDKRLRNLFSPVSLIKNMLGIKRNYNRRLNEFLSVAVNEIKKIFHGQITYASGVWENVNWEIFDMVSTDLYRSSYHKSVYYKELQRYKKYGKPLCITEFGCCAYKGADDKGAMGWAIIDWKKDKPVLKGDYIRDEEVQSGYLLELLNIYKTEKVMGAFAFTFITYNYINNENPLYDLDLGS